MCNEQFIILSQVLWPKLSHWKASSKAALRLHNVVAASSLTVEVFCKMGKLFIFSCRMFYPCKWGRHENNLHYLDQQIKRKCDNMNMFWRYKNSDDGNMLATWKGVLYAILDGTQDRALTEILRIRKIPGHPRRTLFKRLKRSLEINFTNTKAL